MRRIWLIPALLGAVVVYASIDDEAGLRSLLRLRGDLDAARGRIEALRVEIDTLSSQAEALQTQTFALERAIREGLEYARPGETLVQLPRTAEAANE